MAISEEFFDNTKMNLGVGMDLIEIPNWKPQWVVHKRHGDWTAEQIAQGLAPEPYETVVQHGNMLVFGGASCLIQCLMGNGTTTAGQNLTYFSNAQAALGVGDSTTAEAATQTDLQAATNKLRVAMDASYPLHTDGSASKTITAATNASPISVTSTAHGYSTGDAINITGVVGNTAANGTWFITVVDANTYTLNNSTGNGAYTSGGISTKNNVVVYRSTFSNAQANYAWQEIGLFNSASAGVGRMLNRKVTSLGTKTTGTWTLSLLITLS